MPYRGPGDARLPENVRALPENKRAQWVEMWNSAYQRCIDDGGEASTCETSAFRQANGTIKANAGTVAFRANLVEGVRRTVRDGRTWLVAPVILMRAGVTMNGETVPPAEIARSAPAWNGRPVVIGHPCDDEGDYISANAPDVLSRYQVGQIFGAQFVDGALKAELWADMVQALTAEGGPEFVRRLTSNEPMDVSTAYWRDLQGSEAYKLLPDHLAVFPDGTQGACSWSDGCGVPRVNQEDGEGLDANVRDSARRPTFSGKATGEWSAPSLEALLAAYPGDKPDSSDVASLPGAVKRWIAGHSLLGDPGADNLRDLLFFPVVGADGKLYERALRAVIGGRGAQAQIPAGAKESAQNMARRLLNSEFDADLETQGDALPRTDGVLAKALDRLASAVNRLFTKEAQMSKIEELAERLPAFSKCQLGEFSQEQVDALHALIEQEPADHTESVVNEPVEPDPVEEPEETAPSVDISALLDEAFADLGGVAGVKAKLAQIQANEDREKTALVARLAGNERCALNREQLEALDVKVLQGIEASLRPADYRGNGGGPQDDGEGEFEDFPVPSLIEEV